MAKQPGVSSTVATPPLAQLVPAGWNMDTLITLLTAKKDQFTIKQDVNGEILICTGYREREDGCLVNFVERS